MCVASVRVIVFVLMPVAGLYPNQIERHRFHPAFSTNAVGELTERHCRSFKHDAFQLLL